MTGRERLRSILGHRPADRLSWIPLVDGNTLNLLPESLRGNGGFDFYRDLGCDIFLLNGWGLPHSFRSPEWCWPDFVQQTWREEGLRAYREWKTPQGTLTAAWDRGHPTKYPVDSREAIRAYHAMWEGMRFVQQDDTAECRRVEELIGADGVMTRFWGPSAIPLLLENDMGTEHFYYFLFDYPDDMDALIRTMHERMREAFRCLAVGPWESVTLCENTSTYYISPDVYRRYNMPHQRDFVQRVRAAGKTALLHMCGHVHDILDLIKETHCDGIHTLTPPPTGNTPWEDALDVMGDDLIILSCLDPSIFISGKAEDIGPALDRLITPRLRRSPFALGTYADGIPVPEERFRAVQRWMEKNS